MWEGNGRIESPLASSPLERVYNHYSRTLDIRNASILSDILFSRELNILNNQSFISYYNDNHFFVSRINQDQSCNNVLYQIDISNDALYQLSFPSDDYITVHNEFLVKNAFFSNINYFYSIDNGIVVDNGELYTGERKVWHTYLFPESRKMVQVAFSGIWVYDIELTVSTEEVSMLVTNSELMHNYPNPFNPTTSIYFTVETGRALSTHVSIDIFNIKGQKIKSLVNEFRVSGNYQIQWNGKDDSGKKVSSGVYFYHLKTDDYASTKKMILMK